MIDLHHSLVLYAVFFDYLEAVVNSLTVTGHFADGDRRVRLTELSIWTALPCPACEFAFCPRYAVVRLYSACSAISDWMTG